MLHGLYKFKTGPGVYWLHSKRLTVANYFILLFFCFYSCYLERSSAVEQAVACAPVTQRARVRSSIGTSFLGDVFWGFSSPVRQMSGSFRPTRLSSSFHVRLVTMMVCTVFHACVVSEVSPALS